MFKILEPNIDKGYLSLTVEVNGEEWEKAKNKAFEDLYQNLELKGFRKGKIPLEIAKANISDAKVWNEAINEIINVYVEQINDAILKHSIIAKPKIEVKKLSNDELEMSFKAPLSPKVDLPKLEDFKSEIGDLNPTEEEKEEELKKVESLFWNFEQVDGKTQLKDIVVIDFKGTVDGKPFEGGTAEDFELELGSKSFIDGFEAQLVDKETGDEIDVKVTFPETYPVEELASKEAIFNTKIKEAKRKVKISDEEANKKAISFGFESLEQLKDSILSALADQKKLNEYNKFIRNIIIKIQEQLKIDLPKEIVDHEIEHKFEDFKKQLEQSGMNLKDYLKMIGKDENTFKDEDLRKNAEQTILEQIIFEAIKNELSFEVSKDEVEQKYEEISKTQKLSIEELKEQIKEETLSNELEFLKLVEFFIKK